MLGILTFPVAFVGLIWGAAYYGPRLANLPVFIRIRASIQANWQPWAIGLSLGVAVLPLVSHYPALLALLAVRPRRLRIRVPTRKTP